MGRTTVEATGILCTIVRLYLLRMKRVAGEEVQKNVVMRVGLCVDGGGLCVSVFTNKIYVLIQGVVCVCLLSLVKRRMIW